MKALTKIPKGKDSQAVWKTVNLLAGVNGIAFEIRTVAE